MQQQADRAPTSHLHVKTNPVSHHEAACRRDAARCLPRVPNPAVQLSNIMMRRPSDCCIQCGGRLYMCADH
jgi:predicted transglutaminase-like cysteine proteinase